jgi:hypothetical protein
MDRYVRIYCNGLTYMFDTETNLIEPEEVHDGTRTNTTGAGVDNVHGDPGGTVGEEENPTGAD